MERPLPVRLQKTEHLANFIIISTSFAAYPFVSLVAPREIVSWKFAPSVIFPNIVQLLTAHHCIGYNLTMSAISRDISKYLKEVRSVADSLNILGSY